MTNNKSDFDRFEAAFDFGNNDSEPSGKLETYSPNSNLSSGDLTKLLEERMKGKSVDEERMKSSKSAELENFVNAVTAQKNEKAPGHSEKEPMSEEAKEKHQNVIESVKKVINGIAIALRKSKDENEENSEKKEPPRKKLREYTNNADMEKVVFRKPKAEGSFLPKLIMFLCACAATGTVLGLQASSYYNYAAGSGKKIESTMSCLWLWILEENVPFNPFPLQSNVLGMGFIAGFGILGIIGLFIYLDNDAKKQSRVGHEHGNARLGTPKDFKNFKNRFMER